MPAEKLRFGHGYQRGGRPLGRLLSPDLKRLPGVAKPHPHRDTRLVRKLDDGHYLVCHEGEGAVREYDPAGKVVWEHTKVENAGEAVRLPTGNTLIACGTQKRVIEVTPKGEVVWEFGPKDAKSLSLRTH